MSWGHYEWRPYVPVAQKRANAQRHAANLAKKQGREFSPIVIQGRKIATTFWGTAWCQNLEAYSDFANRLPRGATYVRNGSVVDLVIQSRRIEAIVAGSEPYRIEITIDPLPKRTWLQVKQDCSTSIDSLLDLLAGRFSDGVMQRLTRQGDGLFPAPREIKMRCSCPDYSACCKHLAAVMYGVGARLDKQPELLFLLRDVDHQELVTQAVAEGNLDKELSAGDNALAGEDLSAIFGIELDAVPQPVQAAIAKPRRKRSAPAKKRAGATATKSAKRAPGKKAAVITKSATKSKRRVVAIDAATPSASKSQRKAIRKRG